MMGGWLAHVTIFARNRFNGESAVLKGGRGEPWGECGQIMSSRFCGRKNIIHGLPKLGLMQSPKGGCAHAAAAIGENGTWVFCDHIRKFRDLRVRNLTGNDGQIMRRNLQRCGLRFQGIKCRLTGPLAIRAQTNN